MTMEPLKIVLSNNTALRLTIEDESEAAKRDDGETHDLHYTKQQHALEVRKLNEHIESVTAAKEFLGAELAKERRVSAALELRYNEQDTRIAELEAKLTANICEYTKRYDVYASHVNGLASEAQALRKELAKERAEITRLLDIIARTAKALGAGPAESLAAVADRTATAADANYASAANWGLVRIALGATHGEPAYDAALRVAKERDAAQKLMLATEERALAYARQADELAAKLDAVREAVAS